MHTDLHMSNSAKTRNEEAQNVSATKMTRNDEKEKMERMNGSKTYQQEQQNHFQSDLMSIVRAYVCGCKRAENLNIDCELYYCYYCYFVSLISFVKMLVKIYGMACLVSVF